MGDADSTVVDGDIVLKPRALLFQSISKGEPMRNVIVGFILLAMAFKMDETAPRSNVLSSLVQTERSFAKACQAKGIRASFLEFFADDGVAFFPEPLKYKEAVKNLPPPVDPLAVSLEWEPQTGDVAASGDLGYTTGPSVRSENASPEKSRRYGVFFSVWRKQHDDTWKVVVDIGVATPGESTHLGMPFKEPRVRSVAMTGWEIGSDRYAMVLNLEDSFSRSCASKGVLHGYLARVDDDTRLHRTNHMPIVGTQAIRLYLSTETSVPIWTPVAGEMSAAGDLGYAYGGYEYMTHSGDQSVVEKGYYLHVWKRTSKDVWKLVAEVTNAVEPENSH